MSVAIIINPRSGGASAAVARARAEQASALLAASGVDGEVFVTERRGHASDLARSAVTRGVAAVIGWGGDGTINEIASVLMSSPVALGIVPAGSGNGLARELGVPRDPAAAILGALHGRQRVIDAGELCGRPFFSIAGIGIDAHVATAFDQDRSGRRGFVTYVTHSVSAMVRYQCRSYRVGGTTVGRALLVTIANSAQFGNGARIAPGARLDDGLLDLVVFEERSRLRTVLALPRLFLGGLDRVPGVTRTLITDVTIESEDSMAGHIDGEPFDAGTRAAARVLPGVLRVVVG